MIQRDFKKQGPGLVVMMLMAASCAADGNDGELEGGDVPPGTVDVRVEIPEADENFLDLVTPEVVIKAGEEKMYCLHLQAEEDVLVDVMDSTQGKFGHHLVALSTLDPQPPGTLEDCTDVSEMWKYRSFILPNTPLGEGQAVRIPAQMQYVLQFHYVNAGVEDILVRDVARLHKVDADDVIEWVTTFTTNDLHLTIPEENQNGEYERSFDCEMTNDAELVFVGGHMHEEGLRFDFSVLRGGGEPESVYLVDPWIPEFRDSPPVEMMFDEPMQLRAGDILRTTCRWQNSRGRPLEFPEEMCSAFGYVKGVQEPVHCESTE